MIQSKNTDRAVSPVIAVILMVGITVILAGLVGAFVLGFIGSVSEQPEATVSFDQSPDFGNDSYEVRVTAQQLDNADYLKYNVVGPSAGADPAERHTDSDNPDTTLSAVPDENEVWATSGGAAIDFNNLGDGDEIQIIGGLEGEESVITTYSVDDVQGFGTSP